MSTEKRQAIILSPGNQNQGFSSPVKALDTGQAMQR
jgi:hypothetical protein